METQALNPLSRPPISDANAFLQRPLFMITRRPITVEVPETETDNTADETAATAPALMLLGVTNGPDGSVARIATTDGAERRSLRRGEEIGGWMLQEVNPSTVIIRRAGETMVLAIFKGNQTSAPDGNIQETDEAPGIVFETEDTPAQAGDVPKVRVIKPN